MSAHIDLINLYLPKVVDRIYYGKLNDAHTGANWKWPGASRSKNGRPARWSGRRSRSTVVGDRRGSSTDLRIYKCVMTISSSISSFSSSSSGGCLAASAATAGSSAMALRRRAYATNYTSLFEAETQICLPFQMPIHIYCELLEPQIIHYSPGLL